ncbi:MAG: AAA family ATPase, partial [Thiohalocapsa sp.]|nr:AAA family ATPase [Thiohalocapsa sp.]
MRFARLAVPAFGPFTDFALDLPRGDADLHLIFGPNEAGKSSLLRAVGDLLYGIHPRTADSFLHDNKDLRIAATLVGADGRRLAVQRRKGNKNTLLDADGAPRPDDALQGWLGVTDRAFFSTVFALDSDRLREGAESLLSGHGEIGQALFSASLAGTPVHRILSALEAEAATLFDGRKTKGVTIRPLIAAYKERLDASRDAAVRPEDWEQAVAAVAEAAADRDRLDEALRRKIARRDWVQRCLDALPVIGALGEQERLRADLPPSPDLGPPFVTQTEESLRARDAARTRMAALEGTIARLETRVDENRPDQRVLDRAGEIEALHQALAVQRQRRDDLAALQAEQASLSSELAAGMRALGVDGDPAAVEALRTGVAEELGLKEAAKALDEARAKAGQNRDSVDALQQERDGVEVKLAALPVSDPTQLRDALTRTEAAAQFARDLAELEVRAEQAARDCAACHELLPGAPADHAEACALAVPAVAVLRQFADEDGRIATELTSAERAADEAQARDRGLAGELDALERRGALPTEADLDRARVSRDALWTRVVALWRDGEPNDRPQDPPLDEAYPRSVRNADEIADRLRADADSVARAEHLRAQIRGASEDAARARQARAAAESARADWQARWLAAWEPCGLRPGTPEAMREWREHWMALRAAFGLRQSADANLARARSGIDRALALLRPLLPECADDDLLTLRAAAQGSVRDADQSRGAREQLEHRRHDLRADLDILDASFPALEQASA